MARLHQISRDDFEVGKSALQNSLTLLEVPTSFQDNLTNVVDSSLEANEPSNEGDGGLLCVQSTSVNLSLDWNNKARIAGGTRIRFESLRIQVVAIEAVVLMQETRLERMRELGQIKFKRLVPTPVIPNLGNRPSLLNLIQDYEKVKSELSFLVEATWILERDYKEVEARKTELEKFLKACPTCGVSFTLSKM